MRYKPLLVMLLGALLSWSAPMAAEDENLLDNPGFENMSCNFLGCEVKEWNTQLGSATANTSDKYEGVQSVQLKISSSGVNGYINQQVSLPDNEYATGSQFELTIHYKVTTMATGGNLSFDCFWEAAAGGDSEAAAAHEADVLKGEIETAVNSEWQEAKLVTTKPTKTKGLSVGLKFTKGSTVLLDGFSLKYLPPADAFIEVLPTTIPAFSVNIGEPASKTIHVRQGNLSAATTFRIGGDDAKHFKLSATSLAADQSDLDLVITYDPQSTGSHRASLIFDNEAHTAILPDMITLNGVCSDPTKNPEITVSPTTLPTFEAVIGEPVTQKLNVSSANCTDYVYLRVDHVSPAEHGAFTVLESMIAKNYSTDITISFSPQAEGEYKSTLTIYSQGAQSVVVSLNGSARKATEEDIDWKTAFEWNKVTPVTLLNEQFDQISHNKTLVLEGWQNVAALDQRPWWGFDESKTSPVRGDGKYAKATAYQYGKESTGIWETWLVTPPLDYKNAAGKTFTFSVMGEYLPEEPGDTLFHVYYIDPNAPGEVFFQDLTESFDIPLYSDVSMTWRTFFLDLAPYAETMADVFHIAFRYKGPNGGEGAVTYYVDDVSWGRTDLPEILVTPAQIIDDAAVPEVKKVIGAIQVSSRNLTGAITLSVEGANYNRFELSESELPSEGGECIVSFLGEEEGVHEAYIRLSSPGAPDKFVPMAVLCKKPTGVDSQELKAGSQKMLIDGQLIILKDGKRFTPLGQQVQ